MKIPVVLALSSLLFLPGHRPDTEKRCRLEVFLNVARRDVFATFISDWKLTQSRGWITDLGLTGELHYKTVINREWLTWVYPRRGLDFTTKAILDVTDNDGTCQSEVEFMVPALGL